VAPAEVIRELRSGIAQHPALAAAVNLPWIEIVELVEVEEIVAFARYKAELGGGRGSSHGHARKASCRSTRRSHRLFTRTLHVSPHPQAARVTNFERSKTFRELGAVVQAEFAARGRRTPVWPSPPSPWRPVWAS